MSRTAQELRDEWKTIRPLIGKFVCFVDSKIREVEDGEAVLNEAKERIKEAYERGFEDGERNAAERRNAGITLGDEVVAEGDTMFVVTNIQDSCGDRSISGVGLDGMTYCYFEKSDGVERTGKRFKVLIEEKTE